METKLKPILIALSIIGILAMAYYFRSGPGYEVIKVEDSATSPASSLKESSDSKTTEAQATTSKPNRVASPGLKSSTGEDKVLSDEELEELDRYFDQVEKDWDQTMETFFLKELALTNAELKEYKKLRESYDMDRLEAYQEFHEYMLEKYGEKYTYSPSDDMEKFENKVRDQYLDVLRNRLGDDSYKRYLDTLDQFNEKLRREQDPYKGVMVIDF